MNSRIKFIFSFVLTLLSIQGFSQTIEVTGKVTDYEDKTPLVGATVFCAEQAAGIFTDDEGVYTLKLNRTGTISLRFTYIGYDTLVKEIKLVEGKTTYTENIIMFEKGVQGKTVVITAGRHDQFLPDVPLSIIVLDPKTIDLQATTEIQDILQQTPGVDIMDDQINIRGSSGYAYGVGSRVMLMLDGLPLLTPDASFAQFDVIPTDNIKQIEIVKGAASVLYGSSAMGGVVNVIMDDAPAKPKTSVRMRTSIYDKPWNDSLDWDGTSTPVIGSFNIFHSRKIGNHDVTGLIDLYRDTGYRAGTSQKKVRGQILTRFRPLPGMTLGVNATGVIDSSGNMLYWDSYRAGDSIPDSNNVFHPSQGALAGYGTLRRQLNQRYTIDPFFKLLTEGNHLIYYRSRIMKTINTNNTNQSNNNSLFYNDLQYLTPLDSGKMTWVSGGTFIVNAVRGDSLYGGQHHSWNAAVYSQLDGKLLKDKLNFTIGGRYDYNLTDDSIVASAPVMRAGLNYNLFPGNNVRASFGQAFRAPSVAERYTSTVGGSLLVMPNPTLKVERGYSAEIGIRQGFKFGVKEKGGFGFLDIAGFLMDYNNMIEFGVNGTTSDNPFDPNFNAIFSAINITNARITGIEITSAFGYTCKNFTFDFSGGVTLLNPVNKNPTPDSLQVHINDSQDGWTNLGEFLAYATKKKFDNPVFLKYRNKTLARLTASIGRKKWSFTANYQAKSAIKNYDQILNLAVNGASYYQRVYGLQYQMMDFILGYKVSDNAVVSFNLENAFNKQFVVIPGILGEQRKFTFQYKFLF